MVRRRGSAASPRPEAAAEGRGVRPANPVLREPYVRDARDYVQLAEQAYGPIPRLVALPYIWGDALEEPRRAAPDVRIINLETSITSGEHPWPGKGIHYRMNPGNIGCLTAADIDCGCLANNHVLDWCYEGLAETLQTFGSGGRVVRKRGAHRGGSRRAGRAGRRRQGAEPAQRAVRHARSWRATTACPCTGGSAPNVCFHRSLRQRARRTAIHRLRPAVRRDLDSISRSAGPRSSL
jgi:hypothetical protein